MTACLRPSSSQGVCHSHPPAQHSLGKEGLMGGRCEGRDGGKGRGGEGKKRKVREGGKWRERVKINNV